MEIIGEMTTEQQKFASGFAFVFLCRFPFDEVSQTIYPLERKNEIEKCTSIKAKQEKFYAWKLLEIAVNRLIGKHLNELHLYKTNKKWVADDFQFSISHSKNVVAVAISKKTSVGVDVEFFDASRFNEKLAKKILTDCEFLELAKMNETEIAEIVSKKWSEKEAIFKMRENEVFYPTKTQLNFGESKTEFKVVCNENTYNCVVCSAEKSEFEVVLLNGVQKKI